ncbi:uncharacterized protein F4822DRAFT_440310 [Hypoxylon trugodes]|uniref:uncharacterized protein n=1 Tax=Hypoxylon trugodes TaxID=326681 RepID=UPI00219FF5FB|nr:uncharacterized protein F4822DRAFT_440310 [Hypoxylon trugodes]KAI1384157.1 hypothetical protein F4822DRAFT_440310 [Hypoxylon trugodes]
MVPSQVGFITVTTLVACKIALILLEILFSRSKSPGGPKHIFLIFFGCASAFLALVLGCVSFAGLRAKGVGQPDQCENADADIVGDGVRAAAWTQVGILFFITLTGIVHCCKTAVKEIGGGLIVTHLSLAIALLVPLARHELSPIDAILGSLILDAQGNSLSIQLVTKETLAARWQVAIAVTAQLLGLVIEGILVGNFTTNLLPPKSCNCFSVFWWTWFSNCQSVFPNDVAAYWVYFGYRLVNIAHGSYYAISRTRIFSNAEKWDKANPCDPCDYCCDDEISPEREPHDLCRCHPCVRCSYCKVCKRKARCDRHSPIFRAPNTHNNHLVLHNDNVCQTCYRCRQCGHSDLDISNSVLLDGERFSSMPVTISANFLESSVLALLSMISAEVTMNVNGVRKSSHIYNVGQVTALVIAVGTAVRALWVFLYLFDARAYPAHSS